MNEDLVEEIEAEEVQPEPVESLRDTLDKAIVEVREKAEKARDETGKFTKEKLTLPKDIQPVTKPIITEIAPPGEMKEIAAPASWKSEHKQKWSTIDPELQQEILRREEEVHKGFTRLDEERQLGKQIKDVVTPYLATIQAEGGTPVTAVQSLLNTAHILRTADPYTKANHVMQVIKQFNVDLGLLQPQNGQQTQHDPRLSVYEQKLQEVENQLKQQMDLQRQREDAKIMSEIQSFASKPENKYFEQVRPEMQKLLAAGVVPTLEEAYQAAVLANPTVRQLYLAEQSTGVESKRTEQVAAKKKAAVSVSGSSSKSIANAENPNRTLREELEAQFRKSSLD